MERPDLDAIEKRQVHGYRCDNPGTKDVSLPEIDQCFKDRRALLAHCRELEAENRRLHKALDTAEPLALTALMTKEAQEA